jgi:uncharacterized protein
MGVDHIRYDLLTQQALRAVVRRVLTDVAKTGTLPGEHHFYVTFATQAPGVRISARLREQYPEEMTIVLQHQFWDLAVSEQHFEVALSFNGISEKLHVPLDAVKGFFDPSVQFGLQFETVTEGAKATTEDAAKTARPKRKTVLQETAEAPPAIGPAAATKAEAASEAPKEANKTDPAKAEPKAAVADAAEKPEPDKPSGGAEVVRLDRFRKK